MATSACETRVNAWFTPREFVQQSKSTYTLSASGKRTVRICTLSDDEIRANERVRLKDDDLFTNAPPVGVFVRKMRMELTVALTPEYWERHEYAPADIFELLCAYMALVTWNRALSMHAPVATTAVKISYESISGLTYGAKKPAIEQIQSALDAHYSPCVIPPLPRKEGDDAYTDEQSTLAAGGVKKVRRRRKRKRAIPAADAAAAASGETVVVKDTVKDKESGVVTRTPAETEKVVVVPPLRCWQNNDTPRVLIRADCVHTPRLPTHTVDKVVFAQLVRAWEDHRPVHALGRRNEDGNASVPVVPGDGWLCDPALLPPQLDTTSREARLLTVRYPRAFAWKGILTVPYTGPVREGELNSTSSPSSKAPAAGAVPDESPRSRKTIHMVRIVPSTVYFSHCKTSTCMTEDLRRVLIGTTEYVVTQESFYFSEYTEGLGACRVASSSTRQRKRQRN